MEGECWSENICKMQCLGLLDMNEVAVILLFFISIWLMIVFTLMNSPEHLFFWKKKMFDFQWQMQIIYLILNWVEVKQEKQIVPRKLLNMYLWWNALLWPSQVWKHLFDICFAPWSGHDSVQRWFDSQKWFYPYFSSWPLTFS